MLEMIAAAQAYMACVTSQAHSAAQCLRLQVLCLQVLGLTASPGGDVDMVSPHHAKLTAPGSAAHDSSLHSDEYVHELTHHTKWSVSRIVQLFRSLFCMLHTALTYLCSSAW